jgi:exodeoxyribonuclease-5/deoxyribonuclease V
MILAFDTYYYDNKAKTVALSFKNWEDAHEQNVYSEILKNVEEYSSGEFYKRELPCILSLLNKINLSEIDFIIIDGFVYLNDELKKGLGAYLYESLQQKIPIIGVAKNDFISLQKNKRLLFRGESKNPHYITAIGIDLDTAKSNIQMMHGEYRIPTLLKRLDMITKEK